MEVVCGDCVELVCGDGMEFVCGDGVVKVKLTSP